VKRLTNFLMRGVEVPHSFKSRKRMKEIFIIASRASVSSITVLDLGQVLFKA